MRKESKSTAKYVEKVEAKKSNNKNKKIATEIVAKEMGSRSKKSTSMGLVNKIVSNAKKAGKNLNPSDVSKIKKDAKAAKYKTTDTYKRKK